MFDKHFGKIIRFGKKRIIHSTVVFFSILGAEDKVNIFHENKPMLDISDGPFFLWLTQTTNEAIIEKL